MRLHEALRCSKVRSAIAQNDEFTLIASDFGVTGIGSVGIRHFSSSWGDLLPDVVDALQTLEWTPVDQKPVLELLADTLSDWTEDDQEAGLP